MKFSAKSLVASAFAVSMLALPAFANEYISVQVNGNILFLEQPPVLEQGSVLVPLRGIFEALGAEVKWDSATRSVKAYNKKAFTQSQDGSSQEPMPMPTAQPAAGQTSGTANASEGIEPILILPINSPTATVHGNEQKLAAPACMINSTTMVPLRFVSEAMGAKVKWDGPDRMVLVAAPGFESTLGLEETAPAEAPGVDPTAADPTAAATPAPAPVAPLWEISAGLPRIKTGSQAGVTKIMDSTGSVTAYSRTLDDYNTAKITDLQRKSVLEALGIQESDVPAIVKKLINSYAKEHRYRLQLMALMGLLASEPGQVVDANLANRVQAFSICKLFSGDPKLSENDQNAVKRYALLTLALMHNCNQTEVEYVVKFYETNDNLWVTSPMPLFFRLHGATIKRMPKHQEFRERIKNVPSMYTPQILSHI